MPAALRPVLSFVAAQHAAPVPTPLNLTYVAPLSVTLLALSEGEGSTRREAGSDAFRRGPRFRLSSAVCASWTTLGDLKLTRQDQSASPVIPVAASSSRHLASPFVAQARLLGLRLFARRFCLTYRPPTVAGGFSRCTARFLRLPRERQPPDWRSSARFPFTLLALSESEGSLEWKRVVCVPIRFLDSRRESSKTPGAGDAFTGRAVCVPDAITGRAPMPFAVVLRLSSKGRNHLNGSCALNFLA